MANTNLTAAKRAKNDEFYTQYHDIEREMNAYLEYNPNVFRDKTILLPCDDPEWSNFTKYFAQNFKTFGIKKLISTSYAIQSKLAYAGISSAQNDSNLAGMFYQTSFFELSSPQYDASKTKTHGKIFTLTNNDISGDSKIDINDLQWQYLDGDGDFRSDEVKKLRDEADIIITNPPFSLFREFLAWIVGANKQFSIIGNINAITYKETFPYLKNNAIWLGPSIVSGDREFMIPNYIVDPHKFTGEVRKDVNGNDVYYQRVVGVRWFTNLEHGRRHQPLPLMTMEQNLKFSKHKEIRGKDHYEHYDNYDAIEVPYVDAIPSDYDGVMGVPISFLDKYCPEQFDIIGCSYDYGRPKGWSSAINMSVSINGKNVYKRILIKSKESSC